MMKQISKNVLLFGALALLISTVPVQAMEQAPADVQKEVAIKRSFFSKWSDKAKSMRLEALMKELDKHMKLFMKCVKADKGCPRSLVWTIRGILLTITALVVVGSVIGTKKFVEKVEIIPTKELKAWPEHHTEEEKEILKLIKEKEEQFNL